MATSDLHRYRTWLEELHELGEKSPYPLALCSPSGRLLFANDTARTILNLGDQVQVGSPLAEWFPHLSSIDRRAILSPSDFVTFGPIVVQGDHYAMITEPVVGRGSAARLWLVGLLPDGADAERERLGYAGVRAGLERAIAALDESDDVFVITDHEGRVAFVNNEARRTLGAAASAVAGREFGTLFRRSSDLGQAIRNADPSATEIDGMWGEVGGRGRKARVRGLTAGLVRNSDGGVIGAVWLGRVITVAATKSATTTSSQVMSERFVTDYFPEPDRVAQYKKGHQLFRQGTPANTLYIVLEGQVRLFIEGIERPRIIDYIHHGLVGMWDPNENAPRHRYSAEVSKGAKVVAIERVELTGIGDMEMAERVMDLVRMQQVRLLSRVDILLQTSHKRRLARLLVSYAEGATCDDVGLMLPRVSQIDLAEQIGATRKTVSDCLREFAKEQLIRFGDRTIWVRDLNGLNRL